MTSERTHISPLCMPCLELNLGQRFVEGQSGPIDVSTHPGLKNLRALRQSGAACVCCLFLYDNISQQLQVEQNELDDASSYLAAAPIYLQSFVTEASRFDLQCQLGTHLTDEFEIYFNVVFKGDDVLLPWVHPGRLKTSQIKVSEVANNALSRNSHSVIREWLRKCDDEHHCKRSSSEARLPSRYLDVGRADDPYLRLLENEGKLTGRYVALSHCWGFSQHFVLLSSNLDAFKKDIDEANTPKTFQDAIKVTRLLGIQYLWIDSLCIIQDSRRDWETQSALMSHIYKNSYLTISAANSASDAQGFLSPRRPSAARCGQADIDGCSRDVYITEYQVDNFDGLAAGPLRFEPLTNRGWTVQERYLSRRTLVFGSKQLFWECQRSIACEDGRGCGPFEFRMDPGVEGGEEEEEVEGGAYDRWLFTVETYTRCDLTRPSDKLPALSGIATEYAQGLEDVYVAGHWLKDLPLSLVWSPASLEGSIVPTPNYRAPSWSWASVEGAVGFKLRTSLKDGLAEVVGYDVQPAGENMLGELVDATLKLRAPIAKLEVMEEDYQACYGDGTLRLGYDPGQIRFDLEESRENPLLAVFIGTSQEDEKTLYNGLLISPMAAENGLNKRIGVFEDLELASEDFERLASEIVVLK